MWLPFDAPERVLARQLGRPLPFIEVHELLAGAQVRVPKLFAALPEHGVLVVEDLGETLAERLLRDPASRDALYRRAVQDLAAAQQKLQSLPARSIVANRSFDRELLSWEIEHFREWGVEALGTRLSEEEKSAFARAQQHLVESLLGLQQGFCHRDYQSRNLLVLADDSIAWIDFQDALLGPRAYDLVALLQDSYQRFDERFVAARLSDYAEARGLSADEAVALSFEFDLITVQRKLKDAGRFVFFERTRGDPSYLPFYIPTLQLVLGALARLAEKTELSSLKGLVLRQIEIAKSRGMLRS